MSETGKSYSGNDPDKTMDCYPCGCPSCPGFHECYALMPKATSESMRFECDVCGNKFYTVSVDKADYLRKIKEVIPERFHERDIPRLIIPEFAWRNDSND